MKTLKASQLVLNEVRYHVQAFSTYHQLLNSRKLMIINTFSSTQTFDMKHRHMILIHLNFL